MMTRKKPKSNPKKSISVTLTSENIQEIYNSFNEWGYRNVSHLVDDAISRLIKLKREGKQ